MGFGRNNRKLWLIMLEIIMLINGVVFCYLLFSKKLSGKEAENNRKQSYIGIAVFFFFLLVSSTLFLFNNHHLIRLITWGAALIMAIAIVFRLIQLLRKHQ